MFFAATPTQIRRNVYANSGRAMERYLDDVRQGTLQPQSSYTQDETTFTIALDIPGVTKEQLSIAVEGSVVRISSKEGAARNYRAANELPQELDTALSEAKLENGVLTLKLAKKVPVKNVTEIVVQ
jgi:HSP20 family molecular chaperone IbpA